MTDDTRHIGQQHSLRSVSACPAVIRRQNWMIVAEQPFLSNVERLPRSRRKHNARSHDYSIRKDPAQRVSGEILTVLTVPLIRPTSNGDC